MQLSDYECTSSEPATPTATRNKREKISSDFVKFVELKFVYMAVHEFGALPRFAVRSGRAISVLQCGTNLQLTRRACRLH
jgi:hypothetical protein